VRYSTPAKRCGLRFSPDQYETEIRISLKPVEPHTPIADNERQITRRSPKDRMKETK
jgi:hypothetical protein